MRVVIDTNVLISAIFWPGKPKQLLNQVRLGKVTFLTSEILLAELEEVLTRKDKPFKLSEEEALRVLTPIRGLAEVVQPYSTVTQCRDDADNRVLECAIDGKADWIITGDWHLLELHSFKEVTITTVAEFLATIGP
ncbi:MAG TPA: putative toxin-antitoxin system toxin component, PIN family [Candidatus Binatia bacterium]